MPLIKQIRTVHKFESRKNVTKRPNNAMMTRGVHYIPLLGGKVQIGNVTNAQCALLIEELLLHSITVDSKKKITKIKEILLKDEYPNNTKWKKKKFFMPKLLTAPDWSRNIVEDMLKKLEDIR